MPFSANACIKAAPAKPPINVCEDEEGIPYHHVSKFQKMAAIKPASITSKEIKLFTTVLLMVLATAWSLKRKKAAKLNMAAHKTA